MPVEILLYCTNSYKNKKKCGDISFLSYAKQPFFSQLQLFEMYFIEFSIQDE